MQKRFRIEDLSLLQQVHLGLSTVVLLRRLEDSSRVSLKTQYQQTTFGSRYDLYLYAETNGTWVRGYGQKTETEIVRQEAATMTIVKVTLRQHQDSPVKNVVQLSRKDMGIAVDDLRSYFQTMARPGIYSYYNYNTETAPSRMLHILMQDLPGVKNSATQTLHQKLTQSTAISDLEIDFSAQNFRGVLQSLGTDTEVTIDTVSYHCPCSRDQVFLYIQKLSKTEVTDLINNGGRVACQYCNESYQWSAEELEKLLGDPYKNFLGL